MTKNMGTTDRGIRAVLGVVLLVLFFTLEGGIRYIGLLSIVMLLTAAVGYCPSRPRPRFSTRRFARDSLVDPDHRTVKVF